MSVIASLASRWLPTEKARIEINDDGHSLTAKVGKYGQIKSQELKNEQGQSMILQCVGLSSAFQMENASFTLAPSSTDGPTLNYTILKYRPTQGQPQSLAGGASSISIF
jgi:hypothetical protein